MKKNKILTKHSSWRFETRTDQSVSRKKIINHLHNGGEVIYAKRMTASRSLAYLPISGEIFKVIINRKSKCVVSILPWQDVYKATYSFFSEYYNQKQYSVELYPDCYMETKETRALTKIYAIEGDEKTPIEFSHPFYEGLFEAAWNLHLASRRINGNKKDKIIKEKTATFEFENNQEQNNCSGSI